MKLQNVGDYPSVGLRWKKRDRNLYCCYYILFVVIKVYHRTPWCMGRTFSGCVREGDVQNWPKALSCQKFCQNVPNFMGSNAY